MAQCGAIVTSDGLPAMRAGPERHQAAGSAGASPGRAQHLQGEEVSAE